MSLGLTHGTAAPIILRGSNLNLEDQISNASRSHINAKWFMVFVVPVRSKTVDIKSITFESTIYLIGVDVVTGHHLGMFMRDGNILLVVYYMYIIYCNITVILLFLPPKMPSRGLHPVLIPVLHAPVPPPPGATPPLIQSHFHFSKLLL